MKQTLRLRVLLMLIGLLSTIAPGPVLSVVKAATPGNVVINEVAWAGSVDSAYDEWLELYNNSSDAVDLTNWTINRNNGGSIYKITSGSIAAHGYFLIEEAETAVSNIAADAIIHISLANGGDSLQLFDAAGQLMDTVNGARGAWYAGSATTHATMERIDPAVSGDNAANWATSTGSGAQASKGSAIIGTPRAVNSVAGSGGSGGGQSSQVSMQISNSSPLVGDTITAIVKVTGAQDLFAYGFDITYDPGVLQYQSVTQKSFLGSNGTVATSFQAQLENGQPGKLVVAEARTIQPKTGVNGDGELFTVNFTVLGGVGNATALHFAGGSFLASTTGDIVSQMNDGSVTPSVSQIDAPDNLRIGLGVQRYSLQLDWDAANGANGYKVYRKDVHGSWKLLAQTTALSFVDADGVSGGGNIVPQLDYSYQVVAVNGATESVPVLVNGTETRGLKGDNNRSDRVDGRDLEKLARHFGEQDSDAAYDALVDTTYDGRVDGSDLIDLGANFARTYS